MVRQDLNVETISRSPLSKLDVINLRERMPASYTSLKIDILRQCLSIFVYDDRYPLIYIRVEILQDKLQCLS